MDYFKNIPKKLWLYWDGSTLSYLQYMTVKSFQLFHPDWSVTLYMPKYRTFHKPWPTFEQKKDYTGKNYLNELISSGIEIQIIEMESLGFPDSAPEIYKADFIRYYILGKFGGVWSDMDILYIHTISHLNSHPGFTVFGDPKNINTVIVPVLNGTSLRYYTIGIMMSAPDNVFFSDLAHQCKLFAQDTKYQSLGVNMIKHLYPSPQDIKLKYTDSLNILLLPHEVYLPFEWNQLDFIFHSLQHSYIKDHTIGIHWFNGSDVAKDFQNQYDEGNISSNQSTIIYYLQMIQERMTTPPVEQVSHKLKEAFELTYKNNLWNNNESRSGLGSTIEATMDLRQGLALLINKYKIQTIVDLACGDFNWMKAIDLKGIQYYGIDIVPELIHENNQRYALSNIHFICGDISSILFLPMDLVILRDVLVHLTYADIWKILRNIKMSQSKYLLTTSFTNDRQNKDIIESGHRWRTLSLHQAPFHFTDPLETIIENCKEAEGKFFDKSMVLLNIAKLNIPDDHNID